MGCLGVRVAQIIQEVLEETKTNADGSMSCFEHSSSLHSFRHILAGFASAASELRRHQKHPLVSN